MAEWVQVIILAVIALVFIETRINLGSKVALMQRDMQWLMATLQRWGFPSPDHDMAIRMAAASSTPQPTVAATPARR